MVLHGWSTAALASSQTLRVSAQRAAGGLDPIAAVDILLPCGRRQAPTALSVALPIICVSELARRLVAQRPVRVDCVVMLEPDVELAQHSYGIGARTNPGVIALESLHKSLGHAVIRHDSCGAPRVRRFLGEAGYGEPIWDTGRREHKGAGRPPTDVGPRARARYMAAPCDLPGCAASADQ
jgi:hypothetical protein